MNSAVQVSIERHGRQAEALIEVLHDLQQQQGWLPPACLAAVARGLALPLSHVLGVASFYNLFALQPPPRHRCGLCLGTACFVRGANVLLAELQPRCVGDWGLECLSCVGACGLGPLLLVDGRLSGPLPVQDARALIACLAALGLPDAAGEVA